MDDACLIHLFRHLLAARCLAAIRMAKIAEQAHKENADTIPEPYWRYARRWELLGYPAFCATIVIYFLMVMKPI